MQPAIHLDERVPAWNFTGLKAFVLRGFVSSATMRKIVWVGLAVTAFGVLLRTEEEQDGPAVVAAPFLLALGIECLVFALRRHQSRLLLPQQD